VPTPVENEPPPAHLPEHHLPARATVVASQALISGAYSLTRQAVQLGYLVEIGAQIEL
jgi:K+ transporter